MTAQTDESWPYPSRAIVGSRRLMGANLYSARPGAVLEVVVEPDGAAARVTRWSAVVQQLLDRIGWQDEVVVVRTNASGTFSGLFLSAPVDALLAATEVNEQAWLATETENSSYDLEDIAARLRVFIQHDRHPRLTTLVREAHQRGISTAFDDDTVTVGGGVGARTWRLDQLPASVDVPWDAVHDVPVVLVTGSNGKTTTVRLLAAMLAARGVAVGWSCTDGVWVGGACVASGDYSGPAGARTVLQDPRVGTAVLETARGGILRRGLAVERANVAVVTNISDDHLGEYGIDSLRALGEAKLVVARALPANGRIVLNADDAVLRELAPRHAPVLWFSLKEREPFVRAHIDSGGDACVLVDGHLLAFVAGKSVDLGNAADLPLTLGSRMQYNVANALAAAGAALSLGLPPAVIRGVLAAFGRRLEDNPGRLATFTLRGARILLDFVHNPDGWRSLAGGLDGVPGRRIAIVGQAGDRDNRALHELAIAVSQFAPDYVILKEMPSYLRGREPGEVSQILWREFLTLGVSERRISRAPDELTAITTALDGAQPDDLIVVGVHEDFDAAVDAVRAAGAVEAQWR